MSNSTYNKFNTVSYLKADETQWTDNTDDILDLRYIDLEVAGKVAADAQPGDYQLSFVVMDENYVTGSGNIKGNEIIKINMPVNVTVPSFADMFEQEAAEWNTAKTEPQLRFGEAFKKTAKYTDAEYSQVVYAVKYIDSKSPIAAASNTELSTEEGVATVGDGGIATLDKTVVYNTAGDALKETTFANMVAAYPLFYQVGTTESGLTQDELNIVLEAFTVTSTAYTSKLITPLYSIAFDGKDIILDADGKATTKLVLDESNMAVNNANIAASSPAAGLTNSNQAKYTFLPSTSTASANTVKTEFSIEQSGTNVTLDADGIVVTGLTGMSTLKVTFTDATGLIYTSTVKIQPAK